MRYLVAVIFFIGSACAEERDGKVFIKTDPAGAEISLTIGEGENQKFETLGKTPMLAKVPLGKIKLILQMKEFKSAVLELDVKDTTIQKPEAVKLAPILYNIDVLYKEEGWAVWVDGKDTGKKTPDTIELQAGEHKVVLKKDGFKDIGKEIKMTSDVKSIEFTDTPVKFTSVKQPPVTTKRKPLCELQELDVRTVENERFSKGADFDISVKGVKGICSIFLHPPPHGNSHVTYMLDKKYNMLVGGVTISGGINSSAPIVFRIIGDGKDLWKSKPISSTNNIQDFNINVHDINKLELQVDCQGSNGNAHAVWWEPILE